MEEGDEEGNDKGEDDRKFEVRIVEIDEEKEGNEAYSLKEKTVELKDPRFITKRDQMKLFSSGAVIRDEDGNARMNPEKLDAGTDEILAMNFIGLDVEEAGDLSGEDFGELLPIALGNLGFESENFT